MSERFNFFSNNSEPHGDSKPHLNGNGNNTQANGNGNRPHPPNGRHNGPDGRKEETESNSMSGQPHTNPAPTQPSSLAEGQVLSGALKAFSPSSLLSLLSIQKQTGFLYLRNGNLNGYVYVDKGEVFDAGIGPASSGALAVFQLFGWKQGNFSFETGRPAPERRTIEVSLPVLQVRATLWLDNMNKYSQYIPSPSHRISIAAEPRSEVVIEPYQWAVLTKIVSQSVSVAELSLELGQDLMTITRIATELVKMGVAVVHPPAQS